MMAEVVRLAAEQGYHPQTTLSAGDTSEGRPAPVMLWPAMINLGVWSARTCVAVDDAPVGILAGREAGMWTVGLAGSGNALGLDEAAYDALDTTIRPEKLKIASVGFAKIKADFVIATIADLPQALKPIEAAITAGQLPCAADTILDRAIVH